jgi:fatty-acyl-CoA synthase
MNGLMMTSNYSLTLEKLLSRARTVYPEQEIVSRMADASIHRYTFRDFYNRVVRLMNALRNLGVRRGDRVATYSWNHYRHMELYFAIPCMGAVLHTLNIRLPPDKLKGVVDHAEDKVIFADKSLARPVLEVIDRLDTVNNLVIIDDLAPPNDLDFSKTLDYEELLAMASNVADFPKLEETQAAALCYTSGTTGDSKGVLYDHRSLCLHSMALTAADGPAMSMTDNILLVVPMFHVNGWCMPFATCLTGNKIVYPGPYLLGKPLAELIQDESITMAAGIPSIWLLLYRSLRSGNYNIPKLKRLLVGGAAMPQSSIEDYQRELGIAINHCWGMTETSPLGTLSRLKSSMENWPEEQKFQQLAKQGIPVALMELKIVDSANAEKPRDGKSFGELLIRGPWVAADYYKYDETGESPFSDDGWFHTGDIATIDEHGYMNIVDRKKDLIKTRGEWVSSVALENKAVGHSAVLEAAVVGRPDALRGEAVMLYVVFNPDTDTKPTITELCDHLAQDFESWQIPKHKDVHVVDALPKTTVGKIDKKAIRRQLQA